MATAPDPSKTAKKPKWRRARVPSVLQMEAVECAAACLSMILAYFGRFEPLEDLRYRCGVSRDGAKAGAVLAAAQHYGLKAKGFRKEPNGLLDLPLPQILFWNFNHYVVLEGMDASYAYVNDPAVGPRRVPRAEFDEAFTGVTLAFEKGPDFVKQGRPPSPFRGLGRLLSGSGGAFLFIVLAGVGLLAPGLLVPAFTRVYVDYLLIERLDDWLYPLLGAMAAAALLRAALTALQRAHLLRLQTKLALTASCRFFDHVLRLPMRFFAQRFAGDVGSRLQFNDRLAALAGGELTVGALNLLTMIVYAAVMAQYDATLTAIGVGAAAVNLLAFFVAARKLNDAGQKLLMDRGKLTGVAMQGLQMIDTLKASGMDDLFFTRWAGHHAKVVSAEQALERTRRLLAAVPLMLGMVAAALVLAAGGAKVMEGAMTIGALFAFQALLNSFSAPAAGLIGLATHVQDAQGYLARIDDVMRHPIDPEMRAADRPAPSAASVPATPLKLSGRVETRGLTFGFIPGEPPLIDGLDLCVAAGARVALVGGSGSGKSTLGKLLAGLHRPWSGQVLLDDMALDDIPRAALRNSIAMVDQDIALFEGTVRDNITLWDPTLREERVVAAAKDAAVHDEIAARAGAYDAKVLEGGRNFSGGQRQRIEIARALAMEPALLILDEATSALDAVTEFKVVEAVRRRGCACVVIAHRLSTIRDCDEIIVLERGRIVERGTHGALIASDGAYRRLVEA